MMQTQLNLTTMVRHAEKYFPDKTVISRTLGGVQTIPYRKITERIHRLAGVLKDLGVEKGDKVGTIAWNHHRHLEAYFAIPTMGAVLHTINIRVSPDDLAYIINHAEDKILLVDEDLFPLIERVKDQIADVEKIIVMTDKDVLPETSLTNVASYEALLEDADSGTELCEDIDENDMAGLCYTSGTTGRPKGVAYSHRGIYLHSLALGLKDTVGLSEEDIAMPVVPMFHVNAWGMPFAALWFGTTQVLPGPMPTPQILAELMEEHKVTMAAGVPTIWLGFLQALENGNYDTSSLRCILCGGSAAPKGMIRAFESKYKIPFVHAYGMTETSPIVTLARLKSYQQELDEEERLELRSRQGMVVPGIEIKGINENGEIPYDGETIGELLVKGPWIADSYYKNDRSEDSFRDGWLHTGDVINIDEEGSVKIVDRTKDMIKSGGEWISSVDIENALMAHEAVYEASVIAVPDPKWQERPVACVVLKEKETLTEEDVKQFLEPQFAKFWIPDRVLFMEEIPKTSVGKFLKRALRDQVKEMLSLSDPS
ncbi:long-chain fatty acid--CoA ligase [Oceanobacillus neutriphilus]|uniref:Long-chain-fatty-acid--CoA ligase n=1 Tax=Oceanobacillus neutriphilus TaxID=531815 RepID=A0ABQ2NP51_9BACI|nr:long-chain fatty acid--CoA ligase [Oceanobacillus neutriphilus]GGP07168.1 long-chain-fatty-acid--CoA ligase [Oceanobacillus neutriphilus]